MKAVASRWSVTTAALALLVVSSCGSERPSDAGPAPSRGWSSETTVPATVPEDEPEPSIPAAPPAPVTTGPAPTTAVAVYLVKGETLEKVTRRVPKVPGIGRQAMEALLTGPTPAEAAAGVTTAIPAGTRLLGLVVQDGTATVDLSPAYESGGGTLGLTLRLAQVVCTLDQFGTVSGVRFSLAGRPVRVFSGDGIVLEHPVSCDDYRDHLPGGGGVAPPPADPALLTVEPPAAEPGQEMVAALSGFDPDVSVVVELVRREPHGPVLGFDVRADGTGHAEQRFLVPGDAPPGSYSLVATSEDRRDTASAEITVLPSSNCPPEQQPEC